MGHCHPHSCGSGPTCPMCSHAAHSASLQVCVGWGMRVYFPSTSNTPPGKQQLALWQPQAQGLRPMPRSDNRCCLRPSIGAPRKMHATPPFSTSDQPATPKKDKRPPTLTTRLHSRLSRREQTANTTTPATHRHPRPPPASPGQHGEVRRARHPWQPEPAVPNPRKVQ